MAFERGDIVRYIGDEVARQRANILCPEWGALSISEGLYGIVELVDRRVDGEKYYRCHVRMEVPGEDDCILYVAHIEETLYDFEIEKIC